MTDKYLEIGTSEGVWPLRERLILASMVSNSDNQQLTWNIVQKRMAKFTPVYGRDPNWCSAKNCSKQYARMLESADICRKQIVLEVQQNENHPDAMFLDLSPINFLVKRLTAKRLDELRTELCASKSRHYFLRELERRIKEGELTKEQEQEIQDAIEKLPPKNKCPPVHQSSDDEIPIYDLDTKNMENIAAQILYNNCFKYYPDDTWTASNTESSLIETGRINQAAGSSNSLASIIQSASARKLPSALAKTSEKQKPGPSTSNVGKGRRGGGTVGRPRKTESVYQSKSRGASSRRDEYTGSRTRCSMNVYIEDEEIEDPTDYDKQTSDSDNYFEAPDTPRTVPMSDDSLELTIEPEPEPEPEETSNDSTPEPPTTPITKCKPKQDQPVLEVLDVISKLAKKDPNQEMKLILPSRELASVDSRRFVRDCMFILAKLSMGENAVEVRESYDKISSKLFALSPRVAESETVVIADDELKCETIDLEVEKKEPMTTPSKIDPVRVTRSRNSLAPSTSK